MPCFQPWVFEILPSEKSIASSTTSLSSSILDYRTENGRTYHKYKDGKYWIPNDERENDRLDVQHNLFIRTFRGRLGNAPLSDPEAKVGRVLDIGTGSGIWAIDFGEEHPEAEILGVDLSAAQPEFVPPNIFTERFDYIHSRMMTWSISDWKKLFKQCYEVTSSPLSDDGTLKDDSALMQSVRLWESAAEIFGRPFEDTRRLKDFMEEVGFEDVHILKYKWPTNTWPKDPHYKDLGSWSYENVSLSWEGFLMAPLTRAHNWTREEALVHIMEARRDLSDRTIHTYFNVWSIYGRKPMKADDAEN
ncbi:S-adenosyl-L-methionine-dependent methyltransferase [Colletotrichum phormii]|uniref:S-adenosyl-L-methionine-dependent methyltransferase n=1 Tax=Colletotrichum phormii TaxID=359342 RepID=A0AAJ0A2S3_9PEZI|nr:S-adenosyl-L-methionine-dependent methyltransferase [Colletotrichum phormii]KAK1654893.1 S-adenosyl-L-methionine-dependent methyltransferase [Colletotrichum phormii]